MALLDDVHQAMVLIAQVLDEVEADLARRGVSTRADEDLEAKVPLALAVTARAALNDLAEALGGRF